MTWGNYRRAMGPVRWWWFQWRAGRKAYKVGYAMGRHGRIIRDDSQLSGKYDPECAAIFTKKYHSGYEDGRRDRFVFFLCFVGLCLIIGIILWQSF